MEFDVILKESQLFINYHKIYGKVVACLYGTVVCYGYVLLLDPVDDVGGWGNYSISITSFKSNFQCAAPKDWNDLPKLLKSDKLSHRCTIN